MGAVAMQHPGLLQHPLPLSTDYTFVSEPDYIGHQNVNAQHGSGYNHIDSGVDPLRCDDSLMHGDPISYSLPPGNGPQHPSNRPAGHNKTPYDACATDQAAITSSSVLASSSPATSSPPAYTTYPQHNYTSITGLQHNSNSIVHHPLSFTQHAGVNLRIPSTFDGPGTVALPSRSPAHTSHLLPCSSSETRGAYINAAAQSPHPFYTPISIGLQDTAPRVPSNTASYHFPTFPNGTLASHMASSPAPLYNSTPNEAHNFPWPCLEISCQQELTCEGRVVVPEIIARMDKGFFMSPADRSWTCYRRNYFSVACSFELHPHIPNGRLLLHGKQVQAMGMRLSAAVDGVNGKVIELVQYTPKRDVGSKMSIEIQKVSPTPPMKDRTTEQHSMNPPGIFQMPMATFQHTGHFSSPLLPLQSVVDTPAHSSSSASSSPRLTSPDYPYGPISPSQVVIPGQNTQHTFERVQFKSATANNGKRRASQQYFHLIVELFADIRPNNASSPQWEKLAIRVSDKVVVRGRSPSHYKDERPEGGSSSRGGNGGGGDSSSYPASVSSSHTGLSRSGYTTAGASASNVGAFRSSQNYDYKPSRSGSQISSSPSSAYETKDGFPGDAMMPDADGYSYHPATLYETDPSALKFEDSVSGADQVTVQDGRRFAVRDEYPNAIPGPRWPMDGFPRFRGVDSSRGYYPTDLHSTYS